MARGQNETSANGGNPLFGTRSAKKIDEEAITEGVIDTIKKLVDNRDIEGILAELASESSVIAANPEAVEAISSLLKVDINQDDLAKALVALSKSREIGLGHFEKIKPLSSISTRKGISLAELAKAFQDRQNTLIGVSEQDRLSGWKKLLDAYAEDKALPQSKADEPAKKLLEALESGTDFDSLNFSFLTQSEANDVVSKIQAGEVDGSLVSTLNSLHGSVFGEVKQDAIKNMVAPAVESLNQVDPALAKDYEQAALVAFAKGDLSTNDINFVAGDIITKLGDDVLGFDTDFREDQGHESKALADKLNSLSDLNKRLKEVDDVLVTLAEDATENKQDRDKLLGAWRAKLDQGDFDEDDFVYFGKRNFELLKGLHDTNSYYIQDSALAMLNNARKGPIPLHKNPWAKEAVGMLAHATWPEPDKWGDVETRREDYTLESENNELAVLRPALEKHIWKKLEQDDIFHEEVSTDVFPADEIFELPTLGPITQSWIEARVGETRIQPISKEERKRLIEDGKDPDYQDHYFALGKKKTPAGKAMQEQLVEHMVLAQDIVRARTEDQWKELASARTGTLISKEDGVVHSRIGSAAKTLCQRPLVPSSGSPLPEGYRSADSGRSSNDFYPAERYSKGLRSSLPSKNHSLDCPDCKSKAELFGGSVPIGIDDSFTRTLDAKTASKIREAAKTSFETSSRWSDMYKASSVETDAAVERFVEIAKVTEHARFLTHISDGSRGFSKESYKLPAEIAAKAYGYNTTDYFEIPEPVLRKMAKTAVLSGIADHGYNGVRQALQDTIDEWGKTL